MSHLITALKLAKWNIHTEDERFFPLPRKADEV